MPDVRLSPQEADELEKKRDDHGAQQPYASELEDRELEHAHKEGRPLDTDKDVKPTRAPSPAKP